MSAECPHKRCTVKRHSCSGTDIDCGVKTCRRDGFFVSECCVNGVEVGRKVECAEFRHEFAEAFVGQRRVEFC